ncbi:hypothetical protein PANT111_170074 [Pantoea brenneri]|uniref:Uncharacterized protein n=1 Tax=Pantoea brenneri TaxID=472694 RepID=A0AAX3J543_9GAMM|nr:hypothetical protein PANT111_170074 [Pantoea brenneri]
MDRRSDGAPGIRLPGTGCNCRLPLFRHAAAEVQHHRVAARHRAFRQLLLTLILNLPAGHPLALLIERFLCE